MLNNHCFAYIFIIILSVFCHRYLEIEASISYYCTCLQYLGSTPILLTGMGAIKSARMHQAQQAVKLIKVLVHVNIHVFAVIILSM